MIRYIDQLILSTPAHKIILVSGPRQVGKTTLVQKLFPDHEYLNWDNLDHRRVLLDRSWSRQRECIIFDEIHKMPRWKSWIKGIYDAEKGKQRMVVTGSARLNTFRKVGDSLAGRYFSYQLHPFDVQEALHLQVAELTTANFASDILARLMSVGGFPEPFLNGREDFYRQWRRSHLDIVLRQDLLDLVAIQSITKVELLIEHLRSSVGSPISFRSISEDLQISDNTVRAWLQVLEELFVVFRISPYSKNVKRAVLKAPKIYFYDTALITAGEGARFENLVACALLKEMERRIDAGHGDYNLHYIRDRDGHEVDFLIVKDRKPLQLVEAKLSDDKVSASLHGIKRQFGLIPADQVALHVTERRDYPDGISVVPATSWLTHIDEIFEKRK